jgi:sec-independent protein translocase protein TatA
MGGLSIWHILLLVLIAMVFFGPSRLPQLGQSLGKAIRGFKEGLNEIDAEVKPVKDNQEQLNSQQQAQKQTQSEKEKQNS